jgi:hypothetical protein
MTEFFGDFTRCRLVKGTRCYGRAPTLDFFYLKMEKSGTIYQSTQCHYRIHNSSLRVLTLSQNQGVHKYNLPIYAAFSYFLPKICKKIVMMCNRNLTWAGIAQSVEWRATDWTVRVLNSCRGKFSAPVQPGLRPTQPLIQWLTGLFPGGKVAGAWR